MLQNWKKKQESNKNKVQGSVTRLGEVNKIRAGTQFQTDY